MFSSVSKLGWLVDTHPRRSPSRAPCAKIQLCSLPKRDTEQQGSLVHHKHPVQDPSFPLLKIHSGRPREPESPKYPAKKHTHLHQRQVLPCAVCWPVREREERGGVVLSSWRTSAEPSFGKERIWRVEVSGVPLNAVRVKGDVRLFWNNPACTWYFY
jgi:hypothetical protein